VKSNVFYSNTINVLYLHYNRIQNIAMTKDVTTIRIDSNVMNRIKEVAKKENRPISNFIETVLIKYLEEIKEAKNPAD